MPLFGLCAWCLFLSLGVFLSVLGMEPRASCMLNKCSNTLQGRCLFLVQRLLTFMSGPDKVNTRGEDRPLFSEMSSCLLWMNT